MNGSSLWKQIQRSGTYKNRYKIFLISSWNKCRDFFLSKLVIVELSRLFHKEKLFNMVILVAFWGWFFSFFFLQLKNKTELNGTLKLSMPHLQWKMCIILLLLLSRFSRVRLCVTLQKAAHQAQPSLGFSRQEHWSGLPF